MALLKYLSLVDPITNQHIWVEVNAGTNSISIRVLREEAIDDDNESIAEAHLEYLNDKVSLRIHDEAAMKSAKQSPNQEFTLIQSALAEYLWRTR